MSSSRLAKLEDLLSRVRRNAALLADERTRGRYVAEPLEGSLVAAEADYPGDPGHETDEVYEVFDALHTRARHTPPARSRVGPQDGRMAPDSDRHAVRGALAQHLELALGNDAPAVAFDAREGWGSEPPRAPGAAAPMRGRDPMPPERFVAIEPIATPAGDSDPSPPRFRESSEAPPSYTPIPRAAALPTFGDAPVSFPSGPPREATSAAPFPFAPSVVPPSVSAVVAPPSASGASAETAASAAEAPTSARRSATSEEGPTSELERALEQVTRDASLAWDGLARELNGRRSSGTHAAVRPGEIAPGPAVPAPEGPEPHGDDEAPPTRPSLVLDDDEDAPPSSRPAPEIEETRGPASATLAPAVPPPHEAPTARDLVRIAPRSELPPPSRGAPRRRWLRRGPARPGSAREGAGSRWGLIAIAAGVAAIVAWGIARSATRGTSSTPPAAPSMAAPGAGGTSRPPPTADPSVSSPPSAVASGPAAPSATSDAAELGRLDPPTTRDLRDDEGWLLVESRVALSVYLNGSLAGESGRWLRVGCGTRYLRLARRDPPGPGESFPIWLGDGKPLVVPCVGATTIAAPTP